MAWKISTAKRRALVKLQLRDKNGRWIEMGGGVKWYSSKLKKQVAGTVEGAEGSKALVRLNKEYGGHVEPVEASTIEVVDSKATLGPSDGPSADTTPEFETPEPVASTPEADDPDVGDPDAVRREYPAPVADENDPNNYKSTATPDGKFYFGRADEEGIYTSARDLQVGDELIAPDGTDERKPFSIGAAWNRRGIERVAEGKGLGTVESISPDRYAVVRLPDGYMAPDGRNTVTVGLSNDVIKATPGLKKSLEAAGYKFNADAPATGDENGENSDSVSETGAPEGTPEAAPEAEVERSPEAVRRLALLDAAEPRSTLTNRDDTVDFFEKSDNGSWTNGEETLSAGELVDRVEADPEKKYIMATPGTPDEEARKDRRLDMVRNAPVGSKTYNKSDSSEVYTKNDDGRWSDPQGRALTGEQIVNKIENSADRYGMEEATQQAPDVAPDDDPDGSKKERRVELARSAAPGTKIFDKANEADSYTKRDNGQWQAADGTALSDEEMVDETMASGKQYIMQDPDYKAEDGAESDQEATDAPEGPADDSNAPEEAPEAVDEAPESEAPTEEPADAPEESPEAPEAPVETPEDAPEAPEEAPEAPVDVPEAPQNDSLAEISEALSRIGQDIEDIEDNGLEGEDLAQALEEAKADFIGSDGKGYTISPVRDGEDEWSFNVTDEEGTDKGNWIASNYDNTDQIAGEINNAINGGGKQDAPEQADDSSEAAPVDTPAVESYNDNGLTDEEQQTADALSRMIARYEAQGNFERADALADQLSQMLKTGEDRKNAAPAEPEDAPETSNEDSQAPVVAPAEDVTSPKLIEQDTETDEDGNEVVDSPVETPEAGTEEETSEDSAEEDPIEAFDDPITIGSSLFPDGFSVQKDRLLNKFVSRYTGDMRQSEFDKMVSLNRDYQRAQVSDDPNAVAKVEREMAKLARAIDSRLKADPENTLRNRKIDALEMSDVNNIVNTENPSDRWVKGSDGNWSNSTTGESGNSADIVDKIKAPYAPKRDRDMGEFEQSDQQDTTDAPSTDSVEEEPTSAPDSDPAPAPSPEPTPAPEEAPEEEKDETPAPEEAPAPAEEPVEAPVSDDEAPATGESPVVAPEPVDEPVAAPEGDSEEQPALEVNADGYTEAEQQRVDELEDLIGKIYRGEAEGDVEALENELDDYYAASEKRQAGENVPEITRDQEQETDSTSDSENEPEAAPEPAPAPEPTPEPSPEPAPTPAPEPGPGGGGGGRRRRRDFTGVPVLSATGTELAEGQRVQHPRYAGTIIKLMPSAGTVKIRKDDGTESIAKGDKLTPIDANAAPTPGPVNVADHPVGYAGIDPVSGKQFFIGKDGKPVFVGDRVSHSRKGEGTVKSIYIGATSVAVKWDDGSENRAQTQTLTGKNDNSNSDTISESEAPVETPAEDVETPVEDVVDSPEKGDDPAEEAPTAEETPVEEPVAEPAPEPEPEPAPEPEPEPDLEPEPAVIVHPDGDLFTGDPYEINVYGMAYRVGSVATFVNDAGVYMIQKKQEDGSWAEVDAAGNLIEGGFVGRWLTAPMGDGKLYVKKSKTGVRDPMFTPYPVEDFLNSLPEGSTVTARNKTGDADPVTYFKLEDGIWETDNGEYTTVSLNTSIGQKEILDFSAPGISFPPYRTENMDEIKSGRGRQFALHRLKDGARVIVGDRPNVMWERENGKWMKSVNRIPTGESLPNLNSITKGDVKVLVEAPVEEFEDVRLQRMSHAPNGTVLVENANLGWTITKTGPNEWTRNTYGVPTAQKVDNEYAQSVFERRHPDSEVGNLKLSMPNAPRAEVDAIFSDDIERYSGVVDAFRNYNSETSKFNPLSAFAAKLKNAYGEFGQPRFNMYDDKFVRGARVYDKEGNYFGRVKNIYGTPDRGYTFTVQFSHESTQYSKGNAEKLNLQFNIDDYTTKRTKDWDTSTDLDFENATSVSDINKKMNETYAGNIFKMAPRLTDLQTAKDIASTVSKLYNKYPMLKETVASVATEKFTGRGLKYAYASAHSYGPNGVTDPSDIGAEHHTGSHVSLNLNLSREQHLSYGESDQRSGFHNFSKPEDHIKSTMIHEFGHTLDYMTGNISEAKVLELVSKALGREVTRNVPSLGKELYEKKLLSGYSLHSDKKIHVVELVAESFQDVEMNGGEAKLLSKLVHQELMRRLANPVVAGSDDDKVETDDTAPGEGPGESVVTYDLGKNFGEGKTFGESFLGRPYGDHHTNAEKERVKVAVEKFADTVTSRLPDGITLENTSMDWYGTMAQARFIFRNREGQQIGRATRTFQTEWDTRAGRERPDVHHDFFEVNKPYQGKGLSSTMLKEAHNLYRQMGFETITVMANIDVGGFAWARAGFDFDSPEAMEEIVDRFDNAFKNRTINFTREEFQAWEKLKAKATADNWHEGRAPAPIDFAQIGADRTWTDSTSGGSMWVGKKILLGATWNGIKDVG